MSIRSSFYGLIGLSALVASVGWVAACGDSGGGGGEGGSGGEAGSGTTSTATGTGGSGSPSASSSTTGPGSGGSGGSGGGQGGGGGSEPGNGGAGGAGGEGTGGAGGNPGTGGAGGGGEAAKSIAMLYSQFPDPGGSGSGQSSSASGDPVDPNTLYIFLSNQDVACSDPFASMCGEWQVSIGIPPNLQQPGVLQLSNPALFASMSVTDPPDANGECFGGGGGSFMDGTITIMSIDANQVVGKLENTSNIFGFDADGDFTALRCP